MADVFNGLGVRVASLDREEFLKARETLTRMGQASPDGKTLEQTCFLLHKRGQYAIMHWLEMRAMDGEDVILSEDDLNHRDTVARLLDQWGLVYVDDPDFAEEKSEPGNVTVLPYKEKDRYKLKPLYEIGRSHARVY